MRRAIGRSWPALSYHFGIHPWDVERLTYNELRWYRDAAKELADEARRAADATRR